MSLNASSRTRNASRTLAAALMIALTGAGLLAFAVPVPAAVGPAAPWFGPNAMVNAPPAYTAYQPSIATDASGVVYLAYAGWGGSTTQADVFFSRSLDGGRTWTDAFRVNNDAGGATQNEPSLFVDHNADIYAAWTDYRNGNADVFFSKSTDGGLSFSANVRMNDVTGNWQREPDLAVDSAGLIHAVWTDNRNAGITGPDIYYGNSTDGGLSFNPSQRVNNDMVGAEQGGPAIGVAPDRSVYVVWADPRNGARGEDVYFSKSTDLGATWTPNFYLNDDTGNRAQNAPDIAVTEGAVYVAWTDYRDLNTGPDIYATRSTNAGASFAATVRVNDDGGAVWQTSPSLAVNAGTVYAAWVDARTQGSTSRDIYGASSPDGLTWDANVRVNDDSLPLNWQDTPTVAMDPAGDVYAAWFDQRTSGQDVYAAALDVLTPTADAGPSRTVDQGASLLFDAAASTDNLGIASYSWSFGDGAMASGIAATHAYPAPGVYTATLTVWDYSGNADAVSLSITVRDTMAPIARGAGDRTADEGQPLFFDASASTDNVGVAWYLWDFGDNATSDQASATHVYQTPGSYTGSLTVTDAAGNTQSVQFTVTVRTVSPKAGELLGLIQTLDWVVAILAVGLALVGLLAFALWRRKDKPRPAALESSTPPHTQMPPPPPPTF